MTTGGLSKPLIPRGATKCERSFRVAPPNASAPSAECERHPRSLIWQALVLGAASGLFESVSRLTGAFCMLAEGVGGIEMHLTPVTAPVLGPHRYAARLMGSDKL